MSGPFKRGTLAPFPHGNSPFSQSSSKSLPRNVVALPVTKGAADASPFFNIQTSPPKPYTSHFWDSTPFLTSLRPFGAVQIPLSMLDAV